MSLPQFIVCTTAYNLYNKSNTRDVYWQDKTQPIHVFFILKSCHYRFLPHSYQFIVVSLSKHSTTCNLRYWQRRQINNSYKLQEARQTFSCVLLMKVHDDILHGVVRCACGNYCRPLVNSSEHRAARKCGFFLCRCPIFLSCQKCPDWPWGWPSLLFRRYLGLFPRGYIGRGGKLTTSHHLIPKLRMSGRVPPLHHMFSWRAQERLFTLTGRQKSSYNLCNVLR